MSNVSSIKLKIDFGDTEELRAKGEKLKWYKSSLTILHFDDRILYKKIRLKMILHSPKILCNLINDKKLELILTDSNFIDTLNIIDYYSKNYIDYKISQEINTNCCFNQQKNYVPYLIHNFRYGDKIQIHNNINYYIDNYQFYISGDIKFYLTIKRNFIILRMKFIQPRICKII